VIVAARRAGEDPSDEAQYGDRIPYVIIRGAPNSRLVDRAVPPEDVLNDRCAFINAQYITSASLTRQASHKRLDAAYYIQHQLIPPLDRIFCLVGADVKAWYEGMPKAARSDQPAEAVMFSPRRQRIINRLKIDEHFSSSQCAVCGESTNEGELCFLIADRLFDKKG
jgi:DNA polymerase zeta